VTESFGRERCAYSLKSGLNIAIRVVFFVLMSMAGGALLAQTPLQYFYVPLPEDEILAFDVTLDPTLTDTTIHTVIGVTASTTGSLIYYDHWEDGLEPDAASPTQSSTEVWGDGDSSNGSVPGCNLDACDVITSGDVIVAENDVPASPRDSAVVLYDGRDLIASTGFVAATQAAWPVPTRGTVLAGAVEMYDTQAWGNRFELPGGEGFSLMFEDSRVVVMAQIEDTIVNIDLDADGTPETTQVLDAGEPLMFDGIVAGAVITSSLPVQTTLLTGDIGANYEARWFGLVPFERWSNAYVAPVGTTVVGDEAVVLLYNPDDTNSLTIDVTTVGGAGTPIVVGPRATSVFTMPANSGAEFVSTDSRVFFAIASIDNEANIHDWGHTLIPVSSLETSLKVGWAPGSGDPATENSSPIWVTANAATTLSVDFDDDGTPDQTISIAALESVRIYDTSDDDQSGTRISTSGGVLVAAAWGQDPSAASAGNPALDLGTTVLSVPPIAVNKVGVLSIDRNGNGLVDGGDTIRYDITVANPGLSTAVGVFLTDTMDSNTTYVAGTTTRDGASVPDAGATPFPMDEGGLALGSLLSGESTDVSFEALVVEPIPAGVIFLSNEAVVVTAAGDTDDSTAFTAIIQPDLAIIKISSATGPVSPGDFINYTVIVENNSGTAQTGIAVDDALPPGVSYVAESTLVSGSPTRTVLDEFNTVSYESNDGPNSWRGPWTELNEVGTGAGPTAGQVQVVAAVATASNALQLDDQPDSGGQPGLSREADLAGCSSAVFSFDFETTSGLDTSDQITVDVSSNGGGAFTLLENITGLSGVNTSSRSYDLESFVALTSEIVIRYRVTNLYGGGNEFFRADNIEIDAAGCGTKDNIPGGAVSDLVDGTPPVLLDSSDGFALAASENLTITYQVQVDDPLDPFVSTITNTALATSNEVPSPAVWSVIDLVAPGATIGDRVWLDIDGDGVQDVGEPGLANVVVDLVDSSNMLIATPTTDGDGNYLFDHVRPETYTVEVDASTLPAGLAASPGNNSGVSDPIVITDEEEILDADFGYTAAPGTALVGDYIWSDADADGVQDPGEPGLTGVELNLLDDNGSVVATTTTVAGGFYLFAGVAPGDYRVEVASSNFGSGAALDGAVVTSGPQSQGADTSAPISVGAGDVYIDADFGYTVPNVYTISDTVWFDEDSDGVFDASESGISGVSVDLLDASGNVIATATTDANGDVSFSGVPNGSYTVQITDSSGVVSGLTGTTVPAQTQQTAVTVADGDVVGINFGYNQPATIGDRLWSDANGDGVQDPGESGIPGITMALVEDAGADGLYGTLDDVVLSTAVTDASGEYRFEGLTPGSYVVVSDVGPDGIPASGDEELAALGYSQTGDPEGDNDGLGSSSIALGSSDLDQDFGYQNVSLADLSGTVFNDIDGDGVEEPGDLGIAGVTLDLLDDLGNVLATATTDASGNYSFPDLADGDYTVEVTDIAGILDGYELTSGLDSIDVTMAGVDITDVDFGYTQAPSSGSIGDTVYLDSDGDGIQDASEAGIAGVVIELLDENGVAVLDDLGAPITTVTDANGQYVFSNLDPAVYLVRVDALTLPTSISSTTGGDVSSPVALSEGEQFVDADFGYAPDPGTATVGDRVWSDVDGDGLQDPGEIGIGGVDITLAGPGGTTTVTTGPDGSWIATGLAPGDYFVTVEVSTLPTGYNPTPTNTGVTYDVTLAAGDALNHLDYGFDGATSGSIGDTVYMDTDGDGAQNGSETGIAGVTLNLVDSSGNVVATTTSSAGTTDVDGDGNIDPEGSYLFQGLPAGDYTVVVTDVDGVVTGLNVTEEPAGVFTITAAGESIDTADFGYSPAGPNGVIGDFIWHDVDGDGAQGVSESGFADVTVDLWLDVDGNGAITPGVDNLLSTTSTDANGAYQFNGLLAGDYLVEVTDDMGVLAGFGQTADPDEAGVCVVCDELAVIALADGATDGTADFGYAGPPGTTFAISGTVFDDENQSAAHDEPGEPAVPGATVRLYRVVSGVPALIATAISDSNGDYLFSDLPPGDYEIDVDTSGTPVDGFTQTTQAATNGLEPVTLVDQDITDRDFGYWNSTIVATPVTLARFEAKDYGSIVRFEWMTATEVGNLGFNLYAVHEEGMERLNDDLIPSAVVDSVEPQHYTFEAASIAGARYVLEDVDIRGALRFHGPFDLGRPSGKDLETARRTDWSGIRKAHETRKAERRAARRDLSIKAHASGLRSTGALSGGTLSGLGRRDGDEQGFFGKNEDLGARIEVTTAGVYRVTYEALLEAGVDMIGVPMGSLAVMNRGQSVPIRVRGQELFGPGAFVEFVGTPLDTLYTKTNVYRLKVDSARALRVRLDRSELPFGAVPESVAPATVLFEEDNLYTFAAPGDDPWHDSTLLAMTGPAETSREFSLDGWVPGAGTVTIDVEAWGGTDFSVSPDHHLVIDVNGSTVAEATFDGLVSTVLRAELADSLVESGLNTLRIHLPHDTEADFDLVQFDRFRLTYPKALVAESDRTTFRAAGTAFQVGGFTTPEIAVYRVSGRKVDRVRREVTGVPGDYSVTFAGTPEVSTYYLTTSLATYVPTIEPRTPRTDLTEGEAEFVVISHPDFVDALDRFVELRRSEGWSVKVVDTEQLYSRYSYGIFDPVAIQRYLEHAHREMGTVNVLLVGGDTYDYHDNLGLGAISFVPTLYAQTDNIVRYAPVDPMFGDVDGDLRMEMTIGRWPVRTVEELDSVIDKTLEFDGNFHRAVLTAGGYDVPSQLSFAEASDAIASLLPNDWEVERAYADDLGIDGAHDKLVEELNAGAGLVSYFGHSGPTVWSYAGLFDSADVSALENSGQPLLVTQWGCWNTYYVSPTYDTMGHAFLLGEDHGAAAVLGATTLTGAYQEELLGTYVFEEITRPGATLGSAILEAKRRLADVSTNWEDVLLGWTLLGDPTLPLTSPGAP